MMPTDCLNYRVTTVVLEQLKEHFIETFNSKLRTFWFIINSIQIVKTFFYGYFSVS